MAIIKLWTKKGLEKQNNCLLNGNEFGIKYLAVGDGNGSIPNPTEDDTKLVNEVWRSEISELKQDGQKFTVTSFIPESAGDFIIREMGIFDENNELLFVAQMDETPKKASNTGLIKQIGLQAVFELKNGLNAVVVDPSIVTASTNYVSENYQKLSEKGAASGYASLDENGKVPEVQLPNLGGGLEVCDIGMSLYIDETKGLRRWLNGQIVAINQNTQGFLTRLKQIVALYPSLLTTEENWQAAKTLSAFGQVGKFVFNYAQDEETVESVRLPAVVNVQGLLDLQNLGMTVEAGLPNIEGMVYYGHGYLANATGAFYGGNARTLQRVTSGGAETDYELLFDASHSNPIYGATDTVQEEAIQYPYFIQIATGVETENNIINEIELNNPFSFGDSKYSPVELNNISWLKSEGQWNSKAVYTDYYDWILENVNNEVEGFKKFTDTYDDYDWVINTEDETFRLPLLDGSEDIADFTTSNATNFAELTTIPVISNFVSKVAPCNGYFYLHAVSNQANNAIYLDVNQTRVDMAHVSLNSYYLIVRGFVKRGDTIRVHQNGSTGALSAANFFYPAIGNGSLYYYVGETVQNANLIDAGRIAESLANKIDNNSLVEARVVTETYCNGASWYRIWSDGWIEQGSQVSVVNGSAGTQITLIKNYSNTNYCLQVTNVATSAVWAQMVDAHMIGKTNSGFKFIGNLDNNTANWYACGY